MNQSDIDAAIGYVNKLIDNVRCGTCGRLEGLRMRYPCGHSACDDCVIYAVDCPICTPPSQSSEIGAKSDRPMTLTLQKARDLLKASQNLFDVNASQHKRLSEQLKIEKELFPKCIQAPVKYENKRKSTIYSLKNKENLSAYFPGEATSTPKVTKMDDSVYYVQQWLNKNEKNLARKPFADLNVNTQWCNGPKSKNIKQTITEDIPEQKLINFSQRTSRKRTHFTTTDNVNSCLRGNRKSVYDANIPTKIKKETTSNLQEKTTELQKCDIDESGIFMDNDPIVIDDSQENLNDKDKMAWLAVLETCKKDTSLSTSLANCNRESTTSDSFKPLIKPNEIVKTKVKFYKKSAILETCSYCKNDMNLIKPMPVTTQSQPVKITIDTDDFLTTITVFKDVQNVKDKNINNNISIRTYEETESKNSDTDECNKNKIDTEMDLVDDKAAEGSDKVSEDLFADERKMFEVNYQKEKTNKCVVIEESDSDTDLKASGPVHVKADVHRSCQELEYGPLSEIVNVKHHDSKPRRAPRGHTPTSTDSSEKENYNPNRIRRQNIREKKKSTKK